MTARVANLATDDDGQRLRRSALAAALLLLLTESLEGGQLVRRVLARVFEPRRRWDRRLLRILTEQQLGRDLTR